MGRLFPHFCLLIWALDRFWNLSKPNLVGHWGGWQILQDKPVTSKLRPEQFKPQFVSVTIPLISLDCYNYPSSIHYCARQPWQYCRSERKGKLKLFISKWPNQTATLSDPSRSQSINPILITCNCALTWQDGQRRSLLMTGLKVFRLQQSETFARTGKQNTIGGAAKRGLILIPNLRQP